MSASQRSQPKSRATTVSLTHDAYEHLRELAEKQCGTVSQVVRQLVREREERSRAR